MGNLRQKYTDEEWEDFKNKKYDELGRIISKSKKLNPPWIKELGYNDHELTQEEDEWMNVPLGSFLNQNNILPELKQLSKDYTNDQELGAKIRSLINS